MLIDNAKKILLHNTTQRPLNKFPDALQYPFSELSSKSFDIQYKSAIASVTACKLYKETYRRSTYKALAIVGKCVMWLYSNPDKLLQMSGLLSGADKRTLRAICGKLEELGLVEIYQGYSYKTSDGTLAARPLAIKASDKLLQLSVDL